MRTSAPPKDKEEVDAEDDEEEDEEEEEEAGHGSSQTQPMRMAAVGRGVLEMVTMEQVRSRRDPTQRVVTLRDLVSGREQVPRMEGERDNKRQRRSRVRKTVTEEKEDNGEAGDEEVAVNGGEVEEEEEEEEEANDEQKAAKRQQEIARINLTEGLRPEKKPKNSRRSGVKVVWSSYETDKFYDSLRLLGSDFTLSVGRFGNRTRQQMVKKLHQEDRTNEAAVTWAMRNTLNVPAELNPFEVPMPCQLEGWHKEDLDRFYDVLLQEIKTRQQQQQEEQRQRERELELQRQQQEAQERASQTQTQH